MARAHGFTGAQVGAETGLTREDYRELYPEATARARSRNAEPAPDLAGRADPEYQSRIDANRVSLQFRDAIRPRAMQFGVEDLPLFFDERQGKLIE